MTQPVDDARFVEMLTGAQVKLRAYAMSMVRLSADADDVLQNACLALWEKRSRYDANRDFFPWACGIVLVEVLRYRRKSATDRLMFDEVLLNTLATDFINHSEEMDRRRELLHECVAKLNKKDQELLRDRYRHGVKPKEIAANAGLPRTTVYSALTRIREALYRCVEAGIARDAHPRKA